jgi:hypothetical protein
MEILGNDSTFNVLVDIKNTGLTPAFNVDIRYSILYKFYENRITESNLAENLIPIPIKYIMAGQSFVIPLRANDFYGEPTKMNGFKKGINDMYIYLEIKYTDTYKAQHTTRIFRRYNYPFKQFIYCDNFNSSN